MAKTVQIKHVPDDVHRVYRVRAARDGKSLQEYLLGQLIEDARRPTVDELFDAIEQRGGAARLNGEAAVRALREERDRPTS